GAILGNEHFAVLEWTHRAGIDVDVGVQLQHGHLQPACLKNGTERSRGDSLAQRGNNTASDENKTSRHVKPCASSRRGAGRRWENHPRDGLRAYQKAPIGSIEGGSR